MWWGFLFLIYSPDIYNFAQVKYPLFIALHFFHRFPPSFSVSGYALIVSQSLPELQVPSRTQGQAAGPWQTWDWSLLTHKRLWGWKTIATFTHTSASKSSKCLMSKTVWSRVLLSQQSTIAFQAQACEKEKGELEGT